MLNCKILWNKTIKVNNFYLILFESVYDASTESCSYYIEPNTTSTFFDINFNYSGKTYS